MGDQLIENCSTSLLLDQPQPKTSFEDSVFCVTGKFAYDPRSEIEKLIEERGGELSSSITKNVNYLVIGVFASDCIHSTYGRKIEKAVEYRDNGEDIAILSKD